GEVNFNPQDPEQCTPETQELANLAAGVRAAVGRRIPFTMRNVAVVEADGRRFVGASTGLSPSQISWAVDHGLEVVESIRGLHPEQEVVRYIRRLGLTPTG